MDEMIDLRTSLNEANGRLIEMKVLLTGLKIQTLSNKAAIVKDKNPIREVIKEVTVKRARKKPRARIRETNGGSKITEDEVDNFITLFDQGKTYTEISGLTGRSASAISNKIYKRKQETGEI